MSTISAAFRRLGSPPIGETSRERRAEAAPRHIPWLRVSPYFLLHLACLGVIFVGWSPFAVGVAIALYFFRMFAITAFYHRYFSHRAFESSRVFQFVMGLCGALAVQRGPIWWASHHRLHHRHSDTPKDLHSPKQHGFWWAHGGWFLSEEGHVIHWKVAKDLSKYPELVLLDRFHVAIAVLFAFGLFGLGELLASAAPSLGTDGLQLVVWGFCISTVVAYHATYTINSLAHVWGRRRYQTTDTSRNNFWLALLTLGEGWHNNHHRYPVSARQGFRPTEIDLSYLGLRMLAACGLVWNLRPVPASILEEGKRSEG